MTDGRTERQTDESDFIGRCPTNVEGTIIKGSWKHILENNNEERIKIIDHDDWRITKTSVDKINNLWGPLNIDSFKDHKNSKISRFNAIFFHLLKELMPSSIIGPMKWIT